MGDVEPTRERVEAFEAVLGCHRNPGHDFARNTPFPFCTAHEEKWDDNLGCPVAVAAARVEAERVIEVAENLTAQFNAILGELNRG